MNRRYTPDNIAVLGPGEIFVFGSNLAGRHGGGAARAAMERFGAVWGQGVGLQGHSYAIPTMQGGVDTVKPYVEEFTTFAKGHPELFFWVTRIGCGIAGFRDTDIAPLFDAAYDLDNVALPESFCKIIERKFLQYMLFRGEEENPWDRDLNQEESWIWNAENMYQRTCRHEDEGQATLFLDWIGHHIEGLRNNGLNELADKVEAMDDFTKGLLAWNLELYLKWMVYDPYPLWIIERYVDWFESKNKQG